MNDKNKNNQTQTHFSILTALDNYQTLKRSRGRRRALLARGVGGQRERVASDRSEQQQRERFCACFFPPRRPLPPPPELLHALAELSPTSFFSDTRAHSLVFAHLVSPP